MQKKTIVYTSIIIFIVIVILVFSWGYISNLFKKTAPLAVKDSYGCETSAGYVWCQAKNSCIKSSQEKCEEAVHGLIVQNSKTPEGQESFANPQASYTISYPKDAKVNSSDPTCVSAQIGNGYLFINNTSSKPCGELTNLSDSKIKFSEKIQIDGKSYEASGYIDPINFNGYLTFNISNNIIVTYEAKSDTKALTEQQYNDAINSIRDILYTLKSTK